MVSDAEADMTASTVTISDMIGTGEAQGVSLDAGQVSALGEGTVTVSASQVDEHGNAQEVAESTASFEIDTIDPSVASGDDKVDADAEVVVDADTGGMVTISATFDEAMDQGVLPEFILAPDVASTLTHRIQVHGKVIHSALPMMYRMLILMRTM